MKIFCRFRVREKHVMNKLRFEKGLHKINVVNSSGQANSNQFKNPNLQLPRWFTKGYCQQVGYDSICGTKTVPLPTVSVTVFLYFDFKTRNSFYDQCWPYLVSIQKVFFWKKILCRKHCNFEPFCYVRNCEYLYSIYPIF